MAVSKEEREAYEKGRSDRVEPDMLDILTCGTTYLMKEIMSGNPSSSYSDSERSAYNKGKSGKQLDD